MSYHMINLSNLRSGSLSVKGTFTTQEQWIKAARDATKNIEEHGSQNQFEWILVDKPTDDGITVGSRNPFPYAIVAGVDANGNCFYVARTWENRGVYIAEVRNAATPTLKLMGSDTAKPAETVPHEILVRATGVTTDSAYTYNIPRVYTFRKKFSETLSKLKVLLLLDDSESMEDRSEDGTTHWDIAKGAVRKIVQVLLANSNNKGLDIQFVNAKNSVRQDQKVEEEIMDFLDLITPEGLAKIGERLQGLKELYKENLSQISSASTQLSIIVITNGANVEGDASLSPFILETNEFLCTQKKPAFKVGIQFAQIGAWDEHSVAYKKLKELDDNITTYRDMVDMVQYQPELTERDEGYHKMMAKILMGALSNTLDQDQV